MGYTRVWEPEVAPERNDLNAWKTICSDIENSLLLAGLEKTNDTGQLDIESVTTLPEDGTFAGYHIFKFTDPMQDNFPIFIKVEYGCGRYGLASSSSYATSGLPRLNWQLSNATDGSGELINSVSHKFTCPQSYNPASSVNIPVTRKGMSYLSYNKDAGFLGFVYGCGSIEAALPGSTWGRYIGSIFTMFIQRKQGTDGSPTPSGGVLVYGPNLSSVQSTNNLWETGNLQRSVSQYLDSERASPIMEDINRRPDIDSGSTPSGTPLLYPINALGHDQMHSMGCVVQGWVEHLGQGFQFSITLNGVERNYISIGNRTCMSMDDVRAQRSALAILWE